MTGDADHSHQEPATCRLTFLVPLRPRAHTRDWRLVSRLCMATIRSCLKNQSPGIRVLLVGHEKPDDFDNVRDLRLSFLRTETSLPKAFQGTPGMQDKWSKIFQGLVEIGKDPPDYFMFVDADDLVSERLYDFLNEHRPPHGAICKDGYRYKLGARYVKLIRDAFNCGTNAVIATTAVTMPAEVSKEARAHCAPLRSGHTGIEDDMAKNAKPLIRVPFPAVVYVMHAEQHSCSAGSSHLRVAYLIKNRAKNILQHAKEWHLLRASSRVLREFIKTP